MTRDERTCPRCEETMRVHAVARGRDPLYRLGWGIWRWICPACGYHSKTWRTLEESDNT